MAPVSSPTSGVLDGLPLARRIAAAASVPPTTVRWSDAPALPPALTAAATEEWGVEIVVAADGRDPADFAAYAAVAAQARAEQVVGALSHRTNLVLPGARTAVVGDGPLAAALVPALRRIGGRVLQAAADPVVALRAHLAGLETLDADPASWPAVDYVVVTGEGHAPLDPTTLRGVAIDASFGGAGLTPAHGTAVRAHVTRVTEHAWVVGAPAAVPGDLADASSLEWRIADALVALSLLVAGGADAVDARFAEAVRA